MSTDARQLAAMYYHGSTRRFADDLDALGNHPRGIVLYMPELVVLMKPACSTAPESWEQLESSFGCEDAWYIHLLVGNVALAIRLSRALPPLPWLCFRRGMRGAQVHLYRWAQLRRRCGMVLAPHSKTHTNQ